MIAVLEIGRRGFVGKAHFRVGLGFALQLDHVKLEA
jgi:hypothetical protein